MVELDLQQAVDSSAGIPARGLFEQWVGQVLAGRRERAELTIRLVDEPEMAALNETYRGKKGTTNVLSFPVEFPPGIELPLLGDIVICAAVVAREAREQSKPLEAHWAHMVVHGCLHLLGFDHMVEHEAEEMEDLERELLTELGYNDPYLRDE